MDVSRASRFSFARFLPYSPAFLLLFFVRFAVRFLFFPPYRLYTKPVAVVHEAHRNFKWKTRIKEAPPVSRKHRRARTDVSRAQTSNVSQAQTSCKQETSRDSKGSRGFTGSNGMQRDLKVFNRFKGIERGLKGSQRIYKDLKGLKRI